MSNFRGDGGMSHDDEDDEDDEEENRHHDEDKHNYGHVEIEDDDEVEIRHSSPQKDHLSEDVIRMLTPELKVVEVDIKKMDQLQSQFNSEYWQLASEDHIDNLLADYE